LSSDSYPDPSSSDTYTLNSFNSPVPYYKGENRKKSAQKLPNVHKHLSSETDSSKDSSAPHYKRENREKTKQKLSKANKSYYQEYSPLRPKNGSKFRNTKNSQTRMYNPD